MLYFKHHTKMRHDVKIKRLISRYGLEGYGLYVLILESIAEDISTESPMPLLQETCEDIAEFYNCNSAKVDEIVKYMVSQGLFGIETMSKKIAFFKIYKYLEQSQTRSEKIRQLIVAYKDRPEMKQIADMSQTVSDKSDRTEQNRTEEEHTSTRKRDPASLESMELANTLYDLHLKIDPGYKQPNLDTWATDIDKIYRIDGRDWPTIEAVIRWAKGDPFWRSNIISGKKLREKFPQLYAKMQGVDKPKKKQDDPWINF